MKKTLIAVAAAAALATTSAFAEITFGTWMRAITAPISSDGDENYVGMANSWGWGARTARLDVHAVTEDGKAGFEMQMFDDAWNGLASGDHAYLWAKPIDWLKVSMGKFDSPDEVLRGDFCYGSWNWLRPIAWYADDEGFTFDGWGQKGMILGLTPIENLYVYAALPIERGFSKTSEVTDDDGVVTSVYSKTAEDTYKSINVAAAYSIDNFGKIKVGYFGNYSEEESTGYEKFGSIQAAIDLTAVENLYVTAGVKYVLDDTETFGDTDFQTKIALGASYKVSDAFTLYASGAVFLYDNNNDTDPAFQYGVGLDYVIMDGLTLNADLRGRTAREGDVEYEDDSIAFLIGLNKSVSSNASMGIGFQGVTNGRGFNVGDGATLNYDDKFAWAIPVTLSVWF